MKRVLLVDDDPVITRIYQVGLSRRGFQVDSARDGLEAIKALRVSIPDIVVLDLMMPRLSGVEALRLIRKEPRWAALPVVVLSNAYVDQATREAAALGAQKGLLKMGCTPLLLEKVLYEVLEGKPSDTDSSKLLVAMNDEPPRSSAPAPAPVTAQPLPQGTSTPGSPTPARDTEMGTDPDLVEKARREFLANADRTCADLRRLFEALRRAPTEQARAVCLQDFYRKVHFITAGSGLAGCAKVGQMAAAFEALLFGMLNKPARSNPSLELTARTIVDFFPELFRTAATGESDVSAGVEVLVVEDDVVCARMAVAALAAAKLHARSVTRPSEALQLLQQYRYDLVLLDVELPEMNGFGLCERLRQLPGHSETPVIFVTLHSGFETCVNTVRSGGNDLIAKPIVPMELAAKAVMHLLKRQPSQAGTRAGTSSTVSQARQGSLLSDPQIS
ncbi:MAG: response regulator [Limisphaerales bacterium]